MVRPSPSYLVLLIMVLFLFAGGCMEPPIKQPTVSVSNIELADVSLQKMTINTTIVVDNPNPVGGHLNKVLFDVWYLDGTMPVYLGHGERNDIDIRENGNTSVGIPVSIGNLQALYALGSLSQKGSIVLMVNGSAFVDVKVTSWEMKFEEKKEFAATEFEAYLPVSALSKVNVTEGIQTAKNLWSQLTE
jgi:LEA14-like dessication related protein